MKKALYLLKKYYKTIVSVVVVAALAMACISTVVGERRKRITDMGRLVSITPLYNEPVMAASYSKIPYSTLNIDYEEDAGGIRDGVGAYSDGRELTEQQLKDKAALEELLASNDRYVYDTGGSSREDAENRNNRYRLNELLEVNNDISITVTPGLTTAGNSAVGTPIFSSTANGVYQGQFLLTGYCPCVICCGKTNGITASGVLASSNHTIAADSRYSFGTQMVINGQVFTVEDRGGAIKGNHIDIFFNTHAEALAFGKKTADVYLYTGQQ